MAMRFVGEWWSGGRGLAARVGVGPSLGDQAGDELAELADLPPRALVLRRSGHPALGHRDVAALDVEHPAGDVAGAAAAQPGDQRRDVRRVARVPRWLLQPALAALA